MPAPHAASRSHQQPANQPITLSVAHCLGDIELTPRRRARTAYIVVDVIRATTTLAVMFEHGVRRVLVARDVEQARRVRAARPLAILAGEVNAVAPSDFDHGNSPAEWSQPSQTRLADREILFATTNGARGLHASIGGGPVFAGSLRNASAACAAALTAARQLARAGEPGEVAIICSGLDAQPAPDDSLCAGWLIRALQRVAQQSGVAVELGAGAQYALDLLAAQYQAHGSSSADDGDMDADPRRWLEPALAETPAAHNIQRAGLGDDLAWCADVDASSAVPMIAGEDVALRLVIVELAPSNLAAPPAGDEIG